MRLLRCWLPPRAQTAAALGLGLLLGWALAAPAVLWHGRLWAEEGSDFLPYALAHRPWGGLLFAHKQHLDLLPNLAASLAAQGWGQPGHWFVALALLPYGLLVAAAARLLTAVPLLVCLLVGLVWGLHPCGWEGQLNSINSWSVLAAAYLLLLAKPPGPRGLFLASLLPAISFPGLLFLPLALLRRCWPQVAGLGLGGLVQALIWRWGGNGLGLDGLTDHRSLYLADWGALPGALLTRAGLQPLLALPLGVHLPAPLALLLLLGVGWLLQRWSCKGQLEQQLDRWFVPQWLAWQGLALLFSLGGAQLLASQPEGHQRYGVVSVLLVPVLLARAQAGWWRRWLSPGLSFLQWPILLLPSLVLALICWPLVIGLRSVRIARQGPSFDLTCQQWPAQGLDQVCPRGFRPVSGLPRASP